MMNQKTALIVSAGITTFMLVLGGGAAAMANRVSASTTASVQPVITYSNTTASNGDLTPQREAQYVQLINQANAQIKQANSEIALLKEQLKQAQAPTVSQSTQNNITAAQAKTIALNAVPGATVLRVPDLVNYLGADAYEVVLDKGTLYIDSRSAAILDNSAVSQPAGIATNPSNNGSGGDD